MRTSQLINTKSLVRQCTERRQQKFISTTIRKALLAAFQITMIAFHVVCIVNVLKDMIDRIFPPAKFSIKHMCKYTGFDLQEQLLLTEGKPHLN